MPSSSRGNKGTSRSSTFSPLTSSRRLDKCCIIQDAMGSRDDPASLQFTPAPAKWPALRQLASHWHWQLTAAQRQDIQIVCKSETRHIQASPGGSHRSHPYAEGYKAYMLTNASERRVMYSIPTQNLLCSVTWSRRNPSISWESHSPRESSGGRDE